MSAPTIVTSVLTGGTNSHTTSSEEVNGVATDFVSQGVVGTITNTSGVAPATGAFAVNASGTPDANINISTGVAYVTGTPTSQNSQTLRVKCSVTGTLAISANASGSTKYDWIYIKLDATKMANPAVGADDVATIVASRSSSASTDDGTPPTYGYPIAVVTVANGFSTITNGNIRDVRANSTVNLSASSVSSGWLSLGYTPNTVTYNGNRSYDLTFNSVNLTTTLSNGMRLKNTRLVTAPTQCTSLNGTTQYYSKTSPAAMTFTDDFVVSAWVKVASYGSATQVIASRYNGTSGWELYMSTAGQVSIVGRNAGAANFSLATSYQSLPLNKWVHVAAQLDMSSFTASTTTSYIMFDGVDIPVSVSRGGTNPTALVQAGNLEIGGENGGTLPFTGKLAQVAIFNAKVTQATIRTYISQGLSGSETSLISAYSFNNSINDLSSNANNLTAQGSAVATNADSPFGLQADGTTAGTTEYAIITKTAFSTNTTITVQVPEGNAIPTSGGVSAVAYSTQKAPYGMPIQRGKWRLQILKLVQDTQSSPSAGTWYNMTSTSGTSGGTVISIPVGEWVAGYEVVVYVSRASAGFSTQYVTLSTANNTESDADFTSRVSNSVTANTTTVVEIISGQKREKELSLSATTPYYLNSKTDVASITSLNILGGSNGGITKIYADLATL